MTRKLILTIFDGCRPDALALAHTPTTDRLWQTGAYTWTAQTVAPSFTLPTHMSMFRGVAPQKHGVLDNVYRPSAGAFPSVLDIARQNGRTTAMFYSWEQLRDLSAHGSLTVSYCRDGYVTAGVDHIIAEQAARVIVSEQPDLAVVYLCESDLVGHKAGWMSPAYIKSIENMDNALGQLVEDLEQTGVLSHYTLLLLADHGGHGNTHGSDHPEDMTIPWIISGSGIKPGHAIASPVTITDTAATIAHVLGIPRPAPWDGQPVWEVFCE